MKLRILMMLGAATLVASCNNAADQQTGNAEFVPAHNMQQLMQYVVEPQAQTYWQSVQYISDETGQHDIVPETEEEWLRTRSAAATVTEMGNLLLTPQFSEGRGDDWMTYSRALVDIGIKAEQAAADEDVDAVFEVGGTMYNVCSACHQTYVGPVEAPAIAEGDGES